MDKRIENLIKELNAFEDRAFENGVPSIVPEYFDGAMDLLEVVMDSLGLERDENRNITSK